MPVVRPPILPQSEQYQSNFQVQAAFAARGIKAAQTATATNTTLNLLDLPSCIPDLALNKLVSQHVSQALAVYDEFAIQVIADGGTEILAVSLGSGAVK
ncbi:MAG: hypothetical protein K9J74_06760 [Sulfuritalea sp.]|nr:hypothetical protein [Sulfuritalea sp.]